MSDLQRYIAQRKAADPAFAEGFEEGYISWRLRIGSSLPHATSTALVPEYAESRHGEGERLQRPCTKCSSNQSTSIED